jgi:hypothetical protein
MLTAARAGIEYQNAASFHSKSEHVGGENQFGNDRDEWPRYFRSGPSNLCKIERNATVSLSGQTLIMVPGEETQAMPDQCP